MTQTTVYNKKTIARNFKIENKIIFSTKNLKNTQLKKKLFYKFIELFEIVNVVKSQIYCFQFSKQ